MIALRGLRPRWAWLAGSAPSPLYASVVMVTHDPAAAAWADRVVLLRRGAVASDGPAGDAAHIADRLRAMAA
jgi:putative ABC transport system ATP-binding protein